MKLLSIAIPTVVICFLLLCSLTQGQSCQFQPPENKPLVIKVPPEEKPKIDSRIKLFNLLRQSFINASQQKLDVKLEKELKQALKKTK